jgi:hypothetical protein
VRLPPFPGVALAFLSQEILDRKVGQENVGQKPKKLGFTKIVRHDKLLAKDVSFR